MNMAQTIALLGAGTSGFLKGKNDSEDRAAERQRRREDQAFQEEQRARERKEWQDQDTERAGLLDAAAPTAVQTSGGLPDTMDNRDVGQPGEAPVAPIVSTVRGKQFQDSGAAAKYATEQDAPAAVSMRMADVVAKRNPQQAQSLRTGARQEQLGQIQLEDAQRTHLNNMWDEAMRPLTTPDAVAAYISKSPVGGKDQQYKAVPSPDNKTFSFAHVNPDGSLTTLPGVFENSPNGLLLAKVAVSKAVPDSAKIHTLHEDHKIRIEQQKADELTRHNKAVEDNFSERTDAMGAKGVKNAVDRMSEADKLTFNDINKQLEFINSERTKAQLGGMWKGDDPGVLAVQKKEAALMMQRSLLLSRYSSKEGAAPDPLNLRGSPDNQPTTRQPTNMEAIVADMKKTGVTGADVRLEGQPPMRIGEPAGRPQAAPAAAPTAGSTPQDIAGANLDAARGRLAVATAALMKFGSNQRQANPMGFQAAQAEVQAAKQAAEAADAAYQASVPQMAPAIRYSKP